MRRDKFKIYTLELILIIFLFFAVFTSSINRITLSIILLIYMSIVHILLKNKKINSIFNKQVMIWMTIFALVYIGLFYLLGLYFGFMHSKVLFSIKTIFKYIIPLIIIIVSSEIIRKTFLTQNGKIRIKKIGTINLSVVFTYIIMVLIDFIIYNGIYNLSTLDDFLVVLGFVLFASLSCNLLYNYISIRYGEKSIIIYRLITILYIYIIPIVPDVYVFFQSFLRMIYPYLIYLFFDKNFSRFDFIVSYRDRKNEVIGNTILIVVLTLFIMLISCQFKYGILVVGSESMTGTINKGDAVIYERYDKEKINEGSVIIFNYNDIRTIHRVDEIKRVNGVNRYYTKGDANSKRDEGYVTDDKIFGVVKLKVKYIGYPTLWLREMFS